MKKLWSLRKKDNAVSPVIATILMVAITVVLAAVLYVMVLGFGTDTGTQIVISMDKSSTATNWTFTVTGIQGTTSLAAADVYVIVYKADQTVGLTETALTDMTSGEYTNEVRFVDATTANYLEAGDKFTLTRITYLAGSVLSLTDGSGQTYTQIEV